MSVFETKDLKLPLVKLICLVKTTSPYDAGPVDVKKVSAAPAKPNIDSFSSKLIMAALSLWTPQLPSGPPQLHPSPRSGTSPPFALPQCPPKFINPGIGFTIPYLLTDQYQCLGPAEAQEKEQYGGQGLPAGGGGGQGTRARRGREAGGARVQVIGGRAKYKECLK